MSRIALVGAVAGGACLAVSAIAAPAMAHSDPNPDTKTAGKHAAAKPVAAAKAHLAAKPKGGAKAGGGSTAAAVADHRVALGTAATAAGAALFAGPVLVRRSTRRPALAAG
jgi:hypothetical protein